MYLTSVKDRVLETKAKELTLCNEALPQLPVIHLSLSFSHIYIKGVHHTFTTFSNQSINRDHYTAVHL